MALEKAKYYNLDLKPLWENQFASEREYLESQIYFLNDKTLLDTYFSQLATLDWTDFNSAVEQTRKIDSYYFSPDSIVGRRRTAYLELGERKGQGETEIAVDFEPSNPEEAAKLQELRSEIEEVLDRFQIRNVIDLEIVIGRSGRPEFDRINSKESSILRLYLDSTGPNTIGHELFGHVFDADEDHPHANPLLPRYLSAAELVAIKIESQRALLDGEWGRTYLFVEKMFGPNMTTFAEKTTPEKGELKPDAKLTPEEFAIFATPRDKWPQSALLPFDQFLDRAKIESIVQESPDEPVYYLADFLDSQSASLDQLAANDEIYSYVIEKLREKRKIFSRSPFAILATSTQGWLERLPNLAGLVLAQGFFENDPRAISLFPPEQIGTIESGLVGKTKLADEEFLANARANTIVYGQTNLVQPQENPFKKDVELLLEALKS